MSGADGELPLLTVSDLRVHFPVRGGWLRRTTGHIKAVDGVSFQIHAGQALGLVGESGCGKSTVGRAILRLIRAAAGRVMFNGISVLDADRGTLRGLRRQMQMIFQDPAGSLNPRMTVGEIVGEPLLVHGIARGPALRTQVEQLLDICGLWPHAAGRYPHEFSGGQRQRIGIARALALKPKLIICDEPTSALDASVQAQILNLLKDLQQQFGMAYLFISHDLAVVHHLCEHVAVMLNGRIVESGTRDAVIHHPQHEYTQKLLSAVPDVNPRCRRTRETADRSGLT